MTGTAPNPTYYGRRPIRHVCSACGLRADLPWQRDPSFGLTVWVSPPGWLMEPVRPDGKVLDSGEFFDMKIPRQTVKLCAECCADNGCDHNGEPT